MSNFTKLWSHIIESTIWQAPNDLRVLWITILALKDKDHIVRASIPGLAKHANITPDECEQYIHQLMGPDKWSSSKEHEGRRLLPLEAGGGWLVVNGQKYQDFMREEQRKEAVAKAVQKFRAKKRARGK